MSKSREKLVVNGFLVIAFIAVVAFTLWRDTRRVYPNRNPGGESFPSVEGAVLRTTAHPAARIAH